MIYHVNAGEVGADPELIERARTVVREHEAALREQDALDAEVTA